MLRFSPTAWAKLLYLRDAGPTEVGGFALSAQADLLLVEDFALVRQTCSEVTVEFDDEAVADHFNRQFELGRHPQRCGRIWVHTHPGDSALPSHVDEQTFRRVFYGCDWAVMFILAAGGQTHAELYWQAGGGAHLPLDVDVDFSRTFDATDMPAWEAEYRACVTAERSFPLQPRPAASARNREAEELMADDKLAGWDPDAPETLQPVRPPADPDALDPHWSDTDAGAVEPADLDPSDPWHPFEWA